MATAQAILAQAIGSRRARTFCSETCLHLFDFLAMDCLCALLAFARREARRLHVPQVAERLSELLHEVHFVREGCHERVQAGAKSHHEVMASISAGEMARKPKRCKRTAPQPLERHSQLQTCHEHTAFEGSTVPDPHAADLNLTQDDLQDMLTREYEVENLRLLIRQQLHAVDQRSQDTSFKQLCEQSFEFVAESRSRHLVVQVFRAPARLLLLEEWLRLVTAKQSDNLD